MIIMSIICITIAVVMTTLASIDKEAVKTISRCFISRPNHSKMLKRRAFIYEIVAALSLIVMVMLWIF